MVPREVGSEIKNNLNHNKAPGYDLITGIILKEVPRIAMFSYFINVASRISHILNIK